MQLEDYNWKSFVFYCKMQGELGSTKHQSILSLHKSTLHCNIHCKVCTSLHQSVSKKCTCCGPFEPLKPDAFCQRIEEQKLNVL